MAIDTLKHALSRRVELDHPERQQRADNLASGLQAAINGAFEAAGPSGRSLKDALHGTWLGHPLHAAISDVPIGSWTLSFFLDLFGSKKAADIALGAGILSAVPVALAGAADYSRVEDKPKRLGLLHALLNSVALVLYVLSFLARRGGHRPVGVALSTTGLALGSVSAYLGGEMMDALGAGVSRTAWHPVADGFKVAARADSLVDGKLTPGEITVDGQKVPLVLLRRGADIYALDAVCSHWGASLVNGKVVEDTRVECPWHQSTFDMRTGVAVHGPSPFSQPCYEVRVRAGNVEVQRTR